MKRIAVLLVCFILAGSLFFPCGVLAEDTVVVGERLIFEEGSGPIIINERLMLPLRAVSEALDATVYWFGDAKRIQIVRYDSLLSLQIGNSMMGRYSIANGQANMVDNLSMDVPATIHNDRTYVPLRAISEAFNCTIQWDNPNRTATLIVNPITVNDMSLKNIASSPAGTLCSTVGVIGRNESNGLFYLRSLLMNENGDYDRIPLCTPVKTSISDQTAYGEYITAYWLEQLQSENPSGTVVRFSGVTYNQDGTTYLVVNKTTTGIRSLGHYDTYMDSLHLNYTPFENNMIQ